jgi:hypothetical protein
MSAAFLALATQKHLDDLARQAGLTPEWKLLLGELDRLAQIRIRHRGADWLVRANASRAAARLFKTAHVALPRAPAGPNRSPRPRTPDKTTRPPTA